MRTILLALLLTGCARGNYYKAPRVGDPNSKRVAKLLHMVSEQQWQRSGFGRMDDQPSWPWLLVIAADGTACPEFKQIVNEPREGEVWSCSVPWRARRPV